jgi:hypothetical protein
LYSAPLFKGLHSSNLLCGLSVFITFYNFIDILPSGDTMKAGSSKKAMKLSSKLFLVMMALNLFTTAAFTLYAYYEQKKIILHDIDGKLMACAEGVKLAADAYHAKIVSQGAIPPQGIPGIYRPPHRIC